MRGRDGGMGIVREDVVVITECDSMSVTHLLRPETTVRLKNPPSGAEAFACTLVATPE